VAYAFRAAFHPGEYAVNFKLLAPLTLGSFRFGGDKAVDCKAGNIRSPGAWCKLVHHFRSHFTVRSAASGGLSTFPAPVRPVVHVCRHKVIFG